MAISAKRRIERLVYATADRAIVLSNAFKRIMIEQYRMPADRIAVIPGGIDIPANPLTDTRAARDRLGWPSDRPIVLCVRRLARRMGLDVLIDAVDRVRHSVPDVLVMIAGRGTLAEELSARIKAADLTANVRLLGFVADDLLPLAYAAADVSIVPSQSLEGFGLITLESLVEGTPVLVTPVGGLPEAVSGLATDLVLADCGAGAIADGLIRALRQPELLPSAQACRSYVERDFAWPRIAERVLGVYAEAVTSG